VLENRVWVRFLSKDIPRKIEISCVRSKKCYEKNSHKGKRKRTIKRNSILTAKKSSILRNRTI